MAARDASAACHTSTSSARVVLGCRDSTTRVSWGGLNDGLPGVYHFSATVLCLLTLLTCKPAVVSFTG